MKTWNIVLSRYIFAAFLICDIGFELQIGQES